MERWIPVTKALPEMTPVYKDGPRRSKTVLAFNGHYVEAAVYEETFTKRIPRWVSSTGYRCSVTHWMPVPAPPSRESL